MKYIDKACILKALKDAAAIHENIAKQTRGFVQRSNQQTQACLLTTIACIEAGFYDAQEDPK